MSQNKTTPRAVLGKFGERRTGYAEYMVAIEQIKNNLKIGHTYRLYENHPKGIGLICYERMLVSKKAAYALFKTPAGIMCTYSYQDLLAMLWSPGKEKIISEKELYLGIYE